MSGSGRTGPLTAVPHDTVRNCATKGPRSWPARCRRAVSSGLARLVGSTPRGAARLRSVKPVPSPHLPVRALADDLEHKLKAINEEIAEMEERLHNLVRFGPKREKRPGRGR